jgi:hypothetical protein
MAAIAVGAGILPASALPTGTLRTTLGAAPAHAATPAASGGLSAVETWSVTLNDATAPIAQSSPNVANLAGGPAVVVGDRAGNVYAFDLATGSPVPGWPARTGGPIDATPSVTPLPGSDLDEVLVGSGNAQDPRSGGYQAFGPGGDELWYQAVQDPGSDSSPAYGVAASMTVGTLEGRVAAVAGSLDQEEYALDTASGAVLGGWPFFTSDSVFSTAAVADLYGTGHQEIVEGGDQTAGFALGQTETQGGHLRILDGHGGQICHYDTDQTVDSSPAVGGFLAGGATGIVVGTGSYFVGASDTDKLLAFDTDCHLVWSATLDGATGSSPALADVLGNGSLQVLEGTQTASGGGSVWALDAATGQAIWHTSVPGAVIGSVTAADLTGAGYDDVLVPTAAGPGQPSEGVEILDGRTGAVVGNVTASGTSSDSGLGTGDGFQNAPLVTDDPDGTIGITLAGYNSSNQGVVVHYEIPGSNGAAAVGAGSWPMFHGDPQLTGDAGGTPAGGTLPACSVPGAAFAGYDLVAADGGVFTFGGLPFCGSTGGEPLAAPVVGMAMAPSAGGYWLVAADGGVFAYGGARFYGSMGGHPLNAPIVGMAATPDGGGYWLVAADGGVFAFGDARFYGSMGGQELNQPIVGMVASPDGLGYRLVAADGGVFAYGDAQFFGSMGGQKLNQPIVGMADDASTAGYWLVAADGGVFAFGGAPFHGSMGGQKLNQPIVGMAPTITGGGYRLVAADGGVFAYGDAQFFGSMGGQKLNQPIVGMAGL